MEVILLERVRRLGQMGDVVRVATGYARNFLLPQKKALRATKENLAVFEKRRAHLEAQSLQKRTEAESQAREIAEKSFVVLRSAGETRYLYGSVSMRDIVQVVADAGVSVSCSQVRLDSPIRILGLHKVTIDLHPDVEVEITLNVARNQEEAEQQAQGTSVPRDVQEDIAAVEDHGDLQNHAAQSDASIEETHPSQ